MALLEDGYIYCYTNKINGKQYIGQTTNIKRRCKQHIQDSCHNYDDYRYKQPIHCAFRKYGENNFDFKILEHLKNAPREFLSKREVYWIHEKNILSPNGYNLSAGGEANQGNNKSKLTLEQINNIISDLKLKQSIQSVADKYNLSYSYVSDINNGSRLKQKNENYPLQQNIWTLNDYMEIINALKYAKKTMTQISKDFNISRAVLTKINQGKQKILQNIDEDFPIRRDKKSLEFYLEIISVLKNTNYSISKIANMFEVCVDVVKDVNKGKHLILKNIDENFPVRK